jgi:plasmid stabilization system protein ParE
MTLIRMTRRAEADLVALAGRSDLCRSDVVAFVHQLEAACQRVARRDAGVDCGDVRHAYRSLQHGEYVVFLKCEAQAVLLVRVLRL